MTATNHALTGALIGLVVGQPLIALPAAFASHFVCDAIPHFGKDRNDLAWLRTRPFKAILVVDILFCFLLTLVVLVDRPHNWLLAIVCAFLATSPDFYWFGRYRAAQAHTSYRLPGGFGHFAGVIQWFQKPIGAAVEAAWTVAMIVLLLPFLR